MRQIWCCLFFVADDGAVDALLLSDPLPQALILTAIVIGFGVASFSLVLIYRFYKETGTFDMDQLSERNKK